MSQPEIEFELTLPRPQDQPDGTISMSWSQIAIFGNREGLLELAALIIEVANDPDNEFHIHLYPDSKRRLIRNADICAVISKDQY